MRSFSRSSLVVLVLITGIFARPAFSQTNKPPIVFPPLPAETKAFLMDADEFTLLSLNPSSDLEHKGKTGFRGHRVLGETQIGAGVERTRLVNAFEQGIANGGGLFFCFNPRHGIRAKKDGKTIECLICFECANVYIYSESATNGYSTASTPSAIFNASLALHHVRGAAE